MFLYFQVPSTIEKKHEDLPIKQERSTNVLLIASIILQLAVVIGWNSEYIYM